MLLSRVERDKILGEIVYSQLLDRSSSGEIEAHDDDSRDQMMPSTPLPPAATKYY
jgi:hypothetical protein